MKQQHSGPGPHEVTGDGTDSRLLESILDLAGFRADDVPAKPLQLARLSLYDWLLCGLAGRTEPVSHLLREFARREGGAEIASLIGGGRSTARMAALVNGTTSHALDFDDTHFAHIGHLSVGVYPAALAAAEEVGAGIGELTTAFLLGAESAIRVGLALGPGHYNRGFHQTATAGAFGACVAAARLYGLDRDRTAAALGLCSTRASGLKSQFGTMGKPYNAGIAASNGIEAAKLAQLGLSAPLDGLAGPQGFIATHCDDPRVLPDLSGRFLFEDISYKFHACCHGTHAMIEALLDAGRDRGLSLEDVASCQVRTSPRWMNVCDIRQPKTGLEVKFSYRWLAGMTLDDRPTGSIGLYDDALAADPRRAAFAQRVAIAPDPAIGEMQSECVLTLASGERIEAGHDLARPLSPDEIEAKLRRKAADVLGEHAAAIASVLDGNIALDARHVGELLRQDATRVA